MSIAKFGIEVDFFLFSCPFLTILSNNEGVIFSQRKSNLIRAFYP
jgi:hypothetical protein